MFLKYNDGTIEIITGPMFAGKSEELLKRIKMLKIAKIPTLVMKPKFDSRFDQNKIVSRNRLNIDAINVNCSEDIWKHYNNHLAVAIDEVHFFGEWIIDVVLKLRTKGVRVIISGLDMDYLRMPYGVTPKLLAIADNVSKLKAICVICHSAAGFTFRKILSEEQNVLGDSEYDARCWHCHQKGMLEKGKLVS